VAYDKFKRLGIRNITMDDIAQDLGISKKTIYQHFTDKDALVNALMHDELSSNKACCIADRQKAENAIHEIFLALTMMQQTFADIKPTFLHELKKYYFKAYQEFELFKKDFLFNIVKDNLDRGMQEGLYRSDINTEILSAIRLETMTLIFNENFSLVGKYTILEIENEVLSHFLFGIATTKGLKLIEKYKKQITSKNKS
jgi:TetR/AcrR family transcriptional regulator, cholesterol catabolism regulator